MEKLLFIYNAHAGKGRLQSKLAAVLDVFTQAGFLVTAYPTQGPGDAARAARELASGFDRVACSGGDGTLHEVVSGLMELPPSARPPIGYLPAGTTNDFARNLKLPRGMEKMAAVAAAGVPRGVDIGLFGEEYFIYVAAFGAFTDVAYTTPQPAKNALGHLAYVLKGASEIGSLKGYRLRVEHDGGVLEGEYLYGMVSNTVSVGGIIEMPSDKVALDDGLLELILIQRPRSVAQLNAVLRSLARQEPDPEGGIVGVRSARFRITCDEAVPFTLDGEFGGEHEQVEITAVNTPVCIACGS